jgi:hypothetical protein
VLQTVLEMTTYYVLLPYYCLGHQHALLGYVLGYAGQTLSYTLYTLMALGLERERRHYWPVLLVLPFSALHSIAINFFGCVYGVSRDLLFFGNSTKFAPEWTLMKGRCERVALMFRARRFLALAVRSALYGDVPFGRFWVGWAETPWTPSGFEGWTTGKAPRPIVPRDMFLRLLGRKVAAVEPAVSVDMVSALPPLPVIRETEPEAVSGVLQSAPVPMRKSA